MDLSGTVGSVTAASTDNWQLGVAPAPLSVNGDGITTIASLSLGDVISSGINATGTISLIKSTNIDGLNIRAKSLSTLSDTGAVANGQAGNANDLDLTLLGIASATTLGTLSVNGTLENSNITVDNGSINSINVLAQVSDSDITAVSSTTGGGIASITAGDWDGSNIDAKYLSSLSIVGNLSAGYLGNFEFSSITLSGSLANTALGTFKVAGNAIADTINVQAGNVGTMTVGRALDTGLIDLSDPSTGSLSSITVGQWGPNSGEMLIANTVGAISVIGAPGSAASGALALPATLANSTLILYNAQGINFSLNTLTVQGTVENDTIVAESSIGAVFNKTASARSGIGAISVAQDISGTTILVDDSSSTQSLLGRIGSLTVGALGTNGSDLIDVTTGGAVSVTGFTTPAGAGPLNDGSILNSTLQINGNSSFASASTLPSLKVADGITGSTIEDMFGITTLSAAGSLNASTIVTENAGSPSLGFLNSLIVGDIENSTVLASTIAKLQTTGNSSLGLFGSISNSTIAATESSPNKVLTTLTSLSVAGDFSGSRLDVPEQAALIQVFGQVTNSELGVATQAGTVLSDLTVGQWGGGLVNGVGVNGSTLISEAVGTLLVDSNVSRGMLGFVTGYFDIFNNVGGMGLANFSSTGAVQNSIFRLEDGSVGSFITTEFVDSELLVGVRLPVQGNLATPLTAADWDATANQFSIKSFTTTAPAASFVRSDVVAANLGKITLASVTPSSTNPAAVFNPALLSPLTFGIGFRSSLGASAMGTVKIDGTLVTPPVTQDDFLYEGLSG